MKHAIAWLAFLSIISPALAESPFDEDAYKAAKDAYRSELNQNREDWKDAGRPKPGPEKPAKPNKAAF